MQFPVVHEPGKFVVRMADAEAHLVYERDGEVLDVLSTFTPPSLRGQGVAARLTEAVIDFARREGLRIRPTCSYTRAYLRADASLHDLVADE